jgi:D-alanyl-lipoteichoic acid acyltransferase DltB (MBOAT superfamily)
MPLTVAAFFLSSRINKNLSLFVLVVASVIFYSYWDLKYLTFFGLSVFFNFLFCRAIVNSFGVKRKFYAISSIVLNLLCLFYYKYSTFLFVDVSGFSSNPFGSVILPLGISFFTFTQIAFLVDAWRGEVDHVKPLSYAFFVSYFPHLIAGPIIHHKEIIPQVESKLFGNMKWMYISTGLSILVLGLFKKVFIADNIAYYADPVFSLVSDSAAAPTFFEGWIAALAYTFQLYFDFSGYSDMAIGLSLIFGIRLPINFNSPYKASSMIDFWRRWHLTLSRFFRDYVYIPMGGNRKGGARRTVNLFMTMLLCGFWHGAGWTFIVWGAYHGVLLLINHLLHAIFPQRKKKGMAKTIIYRSVTFVLVVVGWVFFRAENLDGAFSIVNAMFGGNGLSLSPRILMLLPGLEDFSWIRSDGMLKNAVIPDFGFVPWIFFAGLIAFFAPNTQQMIGQYFKDTGQGEDDGISTKILWKPTTVWAMAISALAALSLSDMTKVSQFIYFNF